MIECHNTETLDSLIVATMITIVHFGGDWSAPSQIVLTHLKKIESELEGKICFVTLDIYKNPYDLMNYNIIGIPTVCFFRNGKEFARLVGINPIDAYKHRIRLMDKTE